MSKSFQRLTDLDELLNCIPDQREREYFNEALQCYSIGALRASIILSWIVAANNLKGKLEFLAKDGDGKANELWGKIKTKGSDQIRMLMKFIIN